MNNPFSQNNKFKNILQIKKKRIFKTRKERWFEDDIIRDDDIVIEEKIDSPKIVIVRDKKLTIGKKFQSKEKKKKKQIIFIDDGSEETVKTIIKHVEVVDNVEEVTENKIGERKGKTHHNIDLDTYSLRAFDKNKGNTDDSLVKSRINPSLSSIHNALNKQKEEEDERLKIFIEAVETLFDSNRCKIAIVTDGHTGIGLEIVKNLCKQFKGKIYLTSKNIKRGFAAVYNLRQMNFRAAFHKLDVEDKESITEFANYLRRNYLGIDILINNVSIDIPETLKNVNVSRAQTIINVNYFGLLGVCEALFPLLNEESRVVNITSSAGHLTNIPDDDLRQQLFHPRLTIANLSGFMRGYIESIKRGNHWRQGWPDDPNVVSKVGVSALTKIQQRAFKNDSRAGIIVNHVHPGYLNYNSPNEQLGPVSLELAADAPTYLALLPAGSKYPRGQLVWFTREVVDWAKGPLPAVY